jgi:hypothetical protein
VTFYILDHPFLPTPYNHRFFVEKFGQGFAHQGWDVRVVTRMADITQPGLVMFGDHDCFHGWEVGRLQPLFGRVPALRPRRKLTTRPGDYGKHVALKRLAARLRDLPETVGLAWRWYEEKPLLDELGMRVIYTGECCWGEPKSEARRSWREFSKRHWNAHPIEFGAPVDPERVGEGAENEAIDCSYVGYVGYEPEWQDHFRASPRNRIVGTPPYIDEAERLDILRNSKIVLGLHQPENVADCLPIERVYDALAFGAVLITDNPWAVDATEGIGRYAETAEDAGRLADRILSDDGERRELRERGLEFARRRGTYAHRAAEFIALREEVLAQTPRTSPTVTPLA